MFYWYWVVCPHCNFSVLFLLTGILFLCFTDFVLSCLDCVCFLTVPSSWYCVVLLMLCCLVWIVCVCFNCSLQLVCCCLTDVVLSCLDCVCFLTVPSSWYFLSYWCCVVYSDCDVYCTVSSHWYFVLCCLLGYIIFFICYIYLQYTIFSMV